MYVPVYAVSIALVQRSQIFRDPQRVIWRAALGVARSSLFLSAYCSSAWLSTCLLHHIAGKRPITRTTITACTLLPGLASLIEKPSRRTELAIYCLGLALQSAGRRASRSGKAPRLRRVDALLISLSSATIMHCYLRHPETFGAKYKNVFDWIFGADAEIVFVRSSSTGIHLQSSAARQTAADGDGICFEPCREACPLLCLFALARRAGFSFRRKSFASIVF